MLRILKLIFFVTVLVLLIGCQAVQKAVQKVVPEEVVNSTPTGDIEVSRGLDDLDELDDLDDLDIALEELDNLDLE